MFTAAALFRGVIRENTKVKIFLLHWKDLPCLWIGLELSRCSNERERSGHIDGRGGIRFPLLTAADIAL